jgi:acetyl-CoA synthetase
VRRGRGRAQRVDDPEGVRRRQAARRERLSPHKYPREVVFVDDLPKTPSGKLDRKALLA